MTIQKLIIALELEGRKRGFDVPVYALDEDGDDLEVSGLRFLEDEAPSSGFGEDKPERVFLKT